MTRWRERIEIGEREDRNRRESGERAERERGERGERCSVFTRNVTAISLSI